MPKHENLSTGSRFQMSRFLECPGRVRQRPLGRLREQGRLGRSLTADSNRFLGVLARPAITRLGCQQSEACRSVQGYLCWQTELDCCRTPSGGKAVCWMKFWIRWSAVQCLPCPTSTGIQIIQFMLLIIVACSKRLCSIPSLTL